MKKSNILQITGFPEGGIGVHIISLSKGLHRQHNISFVTNFNRQDDRFKNEFITLQQSLIDITHLEIKKKPSISDLVNIFKLYKAYKNKNIDIIHGHGAKGGLYARILGFLLKSKVIYTPHGGSLHDMHGKFIGSIYIFIEKFLYYFTDKFIFESKYSRDIFLTKVNKNKNKLIVNYNGIKVDTNIIKEKVFNKKNIQISAFGLLRHLKGHDILIKAVNILINKGYPIKLTIYGDGEEKNNLENLIHKLQLETHITLFGFVKDSKYYMLKSDIIVHPSRFEALPYVPIEAMNLNIPVVVSNVGGLTEIISDQNNGLVFKSDCIDSLVKKIEQLIIDDELRNQLVKNAKRTVMNHFDEKIMLNNLNEIYQKLLL